MAARLFVVIQLKINNFLMDLYSEVYDFKVAS
jgi:hypothetical protein